jgi:hypothetical protein
MLTRESFANPVFILAERAFLSLHVHSARLHGQELRADGDARHPGSPVSGVHLRPGEANQRLRAEQLPRREPCDSWAERHRGGPEPAGRAWAVCTHRSEAMTKTHQNAFLSSEDDTLDAHVFFCSESAPPDRLYHAISTIAPPPPCHAPECPRIFAARVERAVATLHLSFAAPTRCHASAMGQQSPRSLGRRRARWG